MIKNLVKNFTSWLMGSRTKKDSPLNAVPDAVLNKIFQQAEAVAEAVDAAAVNVVEEVKQEVDKVVAVAKKKAPAKKKPSTTKKPAAKKKA
jgi:hypothetical protein